MADEERDERRGRIEAQRKYGLARMQFDLEQVEPLLRFGRAFADPMRIRILALLAERSMYGQELAEALEVSAPTISHHLVFLKSAGLIEMRRENNYHHYELTPEGLQKIAGMLTVEHLRSIGTTFPAQETFAQPPDEANRQMILEAYFEEGRLLSIPPTTLSRRIVMEKVAEMFGPESIYSEQEVNEMLKRIYPEAATLRRELIDQKLMVRENGRYWLARPKE